MSFNDVTDAFEGWESTYTGERRTGLRVNGRWVDDTPAVIEFDAIILNSSPEDIQVLEEGLRTTESKAIYTQFELIAQTQTTTGDIVNYDSMQWRVYNVAHRRAGNYNKAIAVKV